MWRKGTKKWRTANEPEDDQIAVLWKRTSARGRGTSAVFGGDVAVLLFDAGERPHPTKPDETVHTWRLMLAERD
jgi:hypothetical protein